MNLDLFPFAIAFAVLAAAVIALFAYRLHVAHTEDDTLHVLDDIAAKQVAVANKLERIDRWGKWLTAFTVVFGALVGAFYAYRMFLGHISGA
jgi:hypothetical protein